MKKKIVLVAFVGLLMLSVLLLVVTVPVMATITVKEVVRLTTEEHLQMQPSWSPDGAKIIYASRPTDWWSDNDVWVMNSDGSGKTNLIHTKECEDIASFSPDGTKIVYGQSIGAPGSGGDCGIFIVNSDGTGKTQLTTRWGHEGDPSWSPTGTKIAYTVFAMGWDDGNIWVMNADGSEKKQLTTESSTERNPTWSPDEKKIAYASNEDGNFDIWIINADGTGKIQLTVDPASNSHPSWSPDGTKIAYTSDESGNVDIWIMNVDGTGKIQLTIDPAGDSQPSWSPDGTKIAFTSHRSDPKGDVWVMTLSGITPTPAPTPTPTVTPAPMDIQAEIRNIWTSDSMSPIVLFGQNANLGQVVQADLDADSFSDSLPNWDSRCLGPKNYDMSIVSRFREGDNKVRIVVDITGGTGFNPGSEGYIRIINPDYKITKIFGPSDSDYIGAHPPTNDMHSHYSGFGVIIDAEGGIISWQGRGGCPACGCRENFLPMEFLVEKVVSDEDPYIDGIAPAFGWAMFNHDERNSRLSDSTMPKGVYQKWIGELDGDFFLLKDSISPPLVIGDKVLIAVRGQPSDHWSVALGWFLNQIGIPTPPSLPPPPVIQTVYCMNATNSDVIWEKTFATSAIHLAVSSNRIFVGFDGFDPIIWRSGVFCLKIEDGSVIWHNLGLKPSHGITLADNKLFVDGWGELTAPMRVEKCLYCLCGGDGAPLWKYVLGDDNYDHVEGSVAVANGKVFFTSANNRVYCLDTSTGQKKWTYKLGSKLTSPAIDDGKIYIGAKHKLYCLDQENCNEIWAYPHKSVSGTFHAPTLTADGQLLIYYCPPLFSPEDPRVLCIDRNTGIKRWEFAVDSLSMPGKPNNKVMASVDNKALIYTNEKLLCLDIFTGKTLWEKQIGVRKSDGLCIGEWICIDSPRLADEKVFMSLMRSCLLYYEMVLLCLEPEDLPFCALNCTTVHSSKNVGYI